MKAQFCGYPCCSLSEKGERLKYLDVKKLELIDNIWIPVEIHMTTPKEKQV